MHNIGSCISLFAILLVGLSYTLTDLSIGAHAGTPSPFGGDRLIIGEDDYIPLYDISSTTSKPS